MGFHSLGTKVHIPDQSRLKYSKLNNQTFSLLPKIFVILFVVVLVGFLVSLGAFFNAFSGWFKEEKEKTPMVESFLKLEDKIVSTRASGELLVFAKADINPSALRISRELQWPVVGSVTNGYRTYHQGIDIGAFYNTPIYSVMVGKVVKVIYDGANLGRYVVVQHEKGLKSLYAHMNIVSVREGQRVTMRTKLGSVGLTGFTTGPHLHLSVYLNGKPINPLLILR